MLRAIDGETMTSSTTMSNNYYGRNGFTQAAALGWDNPAIIPNGPFLPIYDNAVIANSVDTFADLGWCTIWGDDTNNPPDQTAMTAHNVSCVVAGAGIPITTANYNAAGFVGALAQDEPLTWGEISSPITSAVNSWQDSRFWWVNVTWTGIGGGPSNMMSNGGIPSGVNTWNDVLAYQFVTPSSRHRKIDLFSIDQYWFAGARDLDWGPMFMLGAGNVLDLCFGGTTSDQACRGTHYGNSIDIMRTYQPAGNGVGTAPISAYLETGNPFTHDPGDGSTYILAHELVWSMWGMIVHGARYFLWFDKSFTGPGQDVNNLTNNAYYKTVVSGQTMSIYNAVKSTTAVVNQLAPVINSPFAIGYCTVSPAGYVYPTPNNSFSNSIDLSTHWYNNKFYLFATTRASQTATNTSATFTINSNASASQATALNEAVMIASLSGTTLTVAQIVENTITTGMPIFGTNIPAGATISGQLTGTTGGIGTYTLSASGTAASTVCTGTKTISISGHQFTDVFPKASTAKVYRID